MTGGIHRLGARGEDAERPTLTVVGCGGAGCNTLARAEERGWVLGHHVAVNTDAQHLLSTRADRKVLLGRRTTRGRGANTDVAVGETACHESREQLEEVLTNVDIVVVLAGLGGGTGTGASPVLAEMARDNGSMAISLSTLPFTVEGETRRDNALVGQASLSRCADISVVLPNDHLLETSPSLSLIDAFCAADEGLLEPIRLLKRLLTRKDMARLRTALAGMGQVHMGRGDSNRNRGYGRALDDSIANLHPPVAPRACDRALVMFRAGPGEPTDDEVHEMVRSLFLSMPRRTRLVWGVHREEGMAGLLRAVVILASSSSSEDPTQ